MDGSRLSDTDGYIFTADAVTRTSAVVRTVEGQRDDMTGQQTALQQLRGNDEVWVAITGTLAGGGHYEGKILQPPTADIAAGSNAAAGDFGSPHTPAYGKLYIQNSPEIDKTTHALRTGRICKGTVMRRQQDGTVWVSIESYDFEACSE